MERHDMFLLALLLAALVIGIVGGGIWLIIHLKPLAHLLLLLFLIASG